MHVRVGRAFDSVVSAEHDILYKQYAGLTQIRVTTRMKWQNKQRKKKKIKMVFECARKESVTFFCALLRMIAKVGVNVRRHPMRMPRCRAKELV